MVSRSPEARVEEFVMRGIWLILWALVKSDKLDQELMYEWETDYYNAGGGTISPRKKVD